MCMQQQQVYKLHCFYPQNRSRVRVLGLSSRRQSRRAIVVRTSDIESENLKLFMENMSIIRENEELRKQARLLHQENLVLKSEFQNRIRNLAS